MYSENQKFYCCLFANLLTVLTTFLRLDLGPVVIFFPLVKPSHPPVSITPCPPTSCRTLCQHDLSYPPSYPHVSYLVFSHPLNVFTSSPLLISRILFFFTTGNPWLIKFLAFCDCCLTLLYGSLYKKLVTPNFKANCGKLPVALFSSTLPPVPSHFRLFPGQQHHPRLSEFIGPS